MSLQAKAFFNLLAGVVAGLAAWTLMGEAGRDLPLLYGTALGLLLGLVEAATLDASSRKTMALIWGLVLGVCGGGIGLLSPSFSWPFIGAFAGMIGGAARWAPRLARQGAGGGFIGGLLGGGAFEIAALSGSDDMTRLIAFTLTGTLTGYCIGLTPDLFKQAWLHVTSGHGAGKDYLLAKPRVTLGRDEQSDVGLFGDASVAPTHAVIECLPGQNRHRLRHVAGGRGAHAYPPTLVNGRAITAEQWLTDGDAVQIGSVIFRFEEKSTRMIVRPKAPLTVTHAPATPTPVPLLAPLPETAPDPAPAPAVPGRPRGARLTALRGPYAGQSFPLSHRTVTLGRGSDRDIALPADTSVSRTHARITYESGRHVLADDGASNGTLLNDRLLSAPQSLQNGDIIQIGATTLRYE